MFLWKAYHVIATILDSWLNQAIDRDQDRWFCMSNSWLVCWTRKVVLQNKMTLRWRKLNISSKKLTLINSKFLSLDQRCVRVKNFWPRVGSGQFFVARGGSGQPSLVWIWIRKISPKYPKFFNFSLQIKKISSGRGQRLVSLLFTAGKKYDRVGSWPISSPDW